MRLTRSILAMLMALTAAPLALAHDCNGYDCGPCPVGESHHHNDWIRGQCSSSAAPAGCGASNSWGGQEAHCGRFSASNSWDGQRATPGAQVAGTILALAGTAFLLAWRSR